MMHKNGLLHCNLKPSNILVDEYGNIRLCDFKKALRVSSMTQSDVRKNKSAMTPCYTAPELFSEEGAYNYKTDLWALGCIMYELALGQVPFFDESVGRLMNKIINEEVNFNRKELQNFSDDFIDVLRRLLDKDPNTRITWNELERHSFWELNLPENETVPTSSRLSSRTKSKENIKDIKTSPQENTNTIVNNVKKKNVDVLRLSRNALQNMMDDREDEYSREKINEVDNADQEFKFDGKDQKNEDYDSDKNDNYNENQNFEKFVKLKSPLEVSVLNVSRVIKRDKRKNYTVDEEVDKSIFRDTELPTLENLLVHQSDKIIKPIIGNKIIEATHPTTYNRAKLPFQVWKLEKFREAYRTNNNKQMENYLLVLYSLMEQYSNKSSDDENLLNILNYFETIIQDKEIANNIINTSFITLFIYIMGKQRNELIKTRICCIIAYLIRYSTVIDNPLDGLCSVLETIVQDKNVELSRKGIATLGEYLFFVTTQAEGEEETNLNWKISEGSLKTFLYALEFARDEVVKFYAVKAIENIAALTQIAKLYFTQTDEFLHKIFEIFKTTKNQELKTSAIYTCSHLIRLQPKLFSSFIEKIPISEIQKYIASESTKNAQAVLNCFLFAVYNENNRKITKSNEYLDFYNFLLSLLENSTPIIKMKVVLIFTLILDECFLINSLGERLFSLLQKLRKENFTELSLAIKVFETSFATRLKSLVKLFYSLISKNKKSKDLTELSKTFVIVSSYSKLSTPLYTQDYLDLLLKVLEEGENESLVKDAYEILKYFSENLVAVNDNHDFVIKRMLTPVLKSCFINENRILPLNISANLITLLLDDDRLYSSTILEEGKTKQINSLIITILPILKEMLKYEDSVFSTLSFLSLIIERNSAFIKFYRSEGIMEMVFELMKDANFACNLNIIKIFIKLIEFSETSFEDIIVFNLIEKVNSLIQGDTGDNSIYTEYLIELFYDLMFKINEKKKLITVNIDKDEFRKFTSKIEPVAKNFKMCIKLLGSDNIVK
jgi:hypothetical protein